MQKRQTRLIGLAFAFTFGLWLLWYWNSHIPLANLKRIAAPDSEDCILVRLAIQSSYPDFLNSHNIAKTYRTPMLRCTAARTGIELRPNKLILDHRFHGTMLYVYGPLYSMPHTFAFVGLVRGDSIRGTSAICHLQRWPWGWAVLGCRHGSYLD